MSPHGFPADAARELQDTQLRHNIGEATRTIRARRAQLVDERADWEALREAGRRIKDEALARLDVHLEQLERAVSEAGGTVHWARDGEEANRTVAAILDAHGAREVIKVKSITTDETGLNDHLAREGIRAWETDLAEMILQLAGDRSSHFLVPAIHLNRSEIRDVLAEAFDLPSLGDDPEELTGAARRVLRERFLSVPFAVSGANFAVAETGTVVVLESEGNGRMCTTLPRVLITMMGIEKVVPRFEDLAVMLQLLPRSSTGERQNPYTSMWTGAAARDGPSEFHLILLDAGRTAVLADAVGRQALRCIRCSACLNICPVYERVGGHAYGSVYPGPIGAILTPQLTRLREGASLPWASSLCGACYEVCPVKIDIPSVLIHMRGRVVRETSSPAAERWAMGALARLLSSRRRYEAAQRAIRLGRVPLRLRGIAGALPGPLRAWTRARELPAIPDQTFREWWRSR